MPRVEMSRISWQEAGFTVRQDKYILQVDILQEEVVRVRSYPLALAASPPNFDASYPLHATASEVRLAHEEDSLVCQTGDLSVRFDGAVLSFWKKGQPVLREYARLQSAVRRTVGIDEDVPIAAERSSSLQLAPHEFRQQAGQGYQAYLRFESDPTEQIVGLGGYQEAIVNKNGGSYELMQRNSQTSLPVYFSDKGYGFLWNYAGIGEVNFAKNHYCWTGHETDAIEYLVFGADAVKEGLERYTSLVGRAPRMPERYLGLWQSKLRYQTLQELQDVYQGYQERDIDLSVLVIDYFHWVTEGSFAFDDQYWQGIEDFAQRCKADLMVSVWPTVETACPLLADYEKEHLLIREAKSQQTARLFQGSAILDMTHVPSQERVRQLLVDNYSRRGISLFWADQAEPELNDYQHATLAFAKGNAARYASQFPLGYLSAIPNQVGDETRPVLIRSAWLGSQEKGALAWSGDIESSFESLAKQIQVGLSMGLSGQAWWTSDIGGFHAYTSDSDYQNELVKRWFQFAVFSPILRMHGDRQPHTPPIGQGGGGIRTSGAGNEIWSFGSDVEACLTKYMHLREALKPYLMHLYDECHEKGLPLMRPLFLEFPADAACWADTSHYMLGSELLVAPVVIYQQREMEVYLPAGNKWVELFTQKAYEGGEYYRIHVTEDVIPVFVKQDSPLRAVLKEVVTDWRNTLWD